MCGSSYVVVCAICCVDEAHIFLEVEFSGLGASEGPPSYAEAAVYGSSPRINANRVVQEGDNDFSAPHSSVETPDSPEDEGTEFRE